MKLKVLIPISILLFSIMALIAGHIYVSNATGSELEFAKDSLRRDVILRASLIESSLNRGDIQSARSFLKGFTGDPDIRAVRLVDNDYIVLMSSSRNEVGKDIRELPPHTDRKRHIDIVLKGTDGHLYDMDVHRNLLEIVYRIHMGQPELSLRPDKTAALFVHKDISRMLAIAQYRESLFAFITAIILSLLSLSLWFILDRKIARPIKTIRDITERISNGELDARVKHSSTNEIGSLARDINKMAASLQTTQRELAENLQRLEASQRAGSIGTWEWNIKTDGLIWSDETYTMFGLDKGKNKLSFDVFHDLVHPDDIDAVMQQLQSSLESDRDYEVKYRIFVDSEIRWIYAQGQTEHDTNGEPFRMLGTVHDITESVSNERQLQAVNEELNYQINTLNQHAIVSITDKDGVIQYVNDKFCKISGYGADELIGNTHNIINSDYHPPEFWVKLWSTISTGKIWRGEIRNRHKEGHYYWVLTTIAPHLGDDGKPDRYMSIRTEITALKAAQNRLRTEHQQLTAIADINNAYIRHRNQNDIFNSILQTYLRLTNSEFGFVGKVSYSVENDQNVLHILALSNIAWDDESHRLYEQQQVSMLEFNRLNSLYGHVLATSSPFFSNDAMRSEYFGELPEGHPPINSFLCMPLFYGREFIGMIGLANRDGGYDEGDFDLLGRVNDTTARVIHENRLQQHNTRLLRAVNSSSSEILVINPKNLSILDANPAACDNLGYDLSELTSLTASDVMITNTSLARQYSELNPTDAEMSIESFNIRKDGTTYPIDARVQLITDETPNVIVAIIQDVSERKHAEERYHEIQKQLFQTQKMEALGHLTGGIAHDFNNMLASILGYSQLCQDQLKSDDPKLDKIANYTDQVITASKRARDLITQMLTFSRSKSDTQEDHTLIKPIISEVVGLLRSSLPSTINIDYEVDNNLPAAAVQPIQLHQVLMNLCINARDAMENVGTITIRGYQQHANDICSSCHKHFNGKYIAIQISDSGSGIPEETIEHIFEPFYTTKETGKGTGMGLSVIHGIVHSHEGHIVVQSQQDQGTSFSIFLALSQEREPSVEEKPQDKLRASLSGITVAIVDDDISVGSFLKEMLDMHEVSSTYFSDSLTALEHIKEHPGEYDLVITDMTMPNLTGLQLAENLVKTGIQTPIILCSGYNSEEINPDSCRELGIHACMTKPIDTRELLKMIADIKDSKLAASKH
ncbi:MAG: PAS domain S-box protein [Gammaproteobacteria bacterium]|nr:PAS domain S-box protein [Gammaproteobacteria bacterium]